MKPWYYSPAEHKGDSVDWKPPAQEEDGWFIKKSQARACACGAACAGDWTAGVHHGVHKCARVVTSITGHKRVAI